MSHLFSANRTIASGLAFVLLAVVQLARGDERAFREHEFREHEFREQEFRDHRFLDSRYHHNHYYPPRGYVFGVLPPHASVVFHGGVQFYFAGGVWYRPDGRARFVVVAPPIGLVIPVLPPFYSTVWVSNVPYYYADDVYYVRNPQGYVVVDPPPSNMVMEQPPNNAVTELPPATVAQAPAATVAQAPAAQAFIYPRQGQSEQQQATDRYECHRWAVTQTGFDPTLSPPGVAAGQQAPKQADYQRALNACLDGRGYTVR
jgi:hypothetical protein